MIPEMEGGYASRGSTMGEASDVYSLLAPLGLFAAVLSEGKFRAKYVYILNLRRFRQ
jgi:hypothetical protein